MTGRCWTFNTTHCWLPVWRSKLAAANILVRSPISDTCGRRRSYFSFGKPLRRDKGKANRNRIELVYLPPYAPEHNPDEFMHNDLKQTMARRCIPKDKAGLKAFLRSHMHRLQKMPAKVRAFFQAPEVRYAA